ncbi:MAG: DUF1330 domain-containing protein [Mangrovicoccus sp.]
MNSTSQNRAARIEAILGKWGDEGVGLPNKAAWAELIDLPEDQPVTLVNFFKMRGIAAYPAGSDPADAAAVSGQDAFQRYAAVSMPSLEKIGGRFLLVAPFGASFIGGEEDWDLVAIGTYPNPEALLALFELDDYRAAYPHRIAACQAQKTTLCLG